ncbi:hypothetical protein V6Z12_A08G273200 [Gossypium hirsutum]
MHFNPHSLSKSRVLLTDPMSHNLDSILPFNHRHHRFLYRDSPVFPPHVEPSPSSIGNFHIVVLLSPSREPFCWLPLFTLHIMVNASPSTQMSWKPISSAIVIACKHALASAITRSGIFSH